MPVGPTCSKKKLRVPGTALSWRQNEYSKKNAHFCCRVEGEGNVFKAGRKR